MPSSRGWLTYPPAIARDGAVATRVRGGDPEAPAVPPNVPRRSRRPRSNSPAPSSGGTSLVQIPDVKSKRTRRCARFQAEAADKLPHCSCIHGVVECTDRQDRDTYAAPAVTAHNLITPFGRRSLPLSHKGASSSGQRQLYERRHGPSSPAARRQPTGVAKSPGPSGPSPGSKDSSQHTEGCNSLFQGPSCVQQDAQPPLQPYAAQDTKAMLSSAPTTIEQATAFSPASFRSAARRFPISLAASLNGDFLDQASCIAEAAQTLESLWGSGAPDLCLLWPAAPAKRPGRLLLEQSAWVPWDHLPAGPREVFVYTDGSKKGSSGAGAAVVFTQGDHGEWRYHGAIVVRADDWLQQWECCPTSASMESCALCAGRCGWRVAANVTFSLMDLQACRPCRVFGPSPSLPPGARAGLQQPQEFCSAWGRF